ncbi:GntR family transcriptional regulator [Rhodobacter lacus]|uniref:GntR family transcriptional regulator n=1 Tax=Rhodobacter lacus TaxID=1641972 RepID=A0ABW5A8X5_9RHOB
MYFPVLTGSFEMAPMTDGPERDIDDPASGEEITEAEIVERIFEAVMERRLAAGTKLSESELCKAFGVGRMRIRRALLLLAAREVVELRSNRGAYVACPSPAQARDVIEARAALEPAVARLVAERAAPETLAALAAVLEEEAAAHARGSRHEAIRLSGQFHLRLAEASGNATLVRILKDLVTRSSLIVAIYGAAGLETCRDHDHATLLAALHARDGAEAERVMAAHLADIFATLDLSGRMPAGLDLAQLLARP